MINKYEINLVKKDCAPFLNELRGGLLFRGIKKPTVLNNISTNISKIMVRKDRKPRNTPEAYHFAADEWFHKRFGVKYRSQSVFCTGSYGAASLYGRVYAMFPLGDFSFCWSPTVHDMLGLCIDPNCSSEKSFLNVLGSSNYRDVGLDDAMKSNNETMICCNECYAISLDSEDKVKVLKNVI